MLTIIAAKSQNNVIGSNNKLPWRQKNDLQRFKALTYGETIIMGRKTWDSIGAKPLPNRNNVIVSKSLPENRVCTKNSEIITFANSAEKVFNHYDTAERDVYVIGGAQLYEIAMHYADKLIITELECAVPGDAFFPDIDLDIWKVVAREKYQADADNDFDYNFVTYARK